MSATTAKQEALRELINPGGRYVDAVATAVLEAITALEVDGPYDFNTPEGTEAIRTAVASIPVPQSVGGGEQQLVVADTLEYTEQEEEFLSTETVDPNLLRAAHARKRELEATGRQFAQPCLDMLSDGLGIRARGYDVYSVTREYCDSAEELSYRITLLDSTGSTVMANLGAADAVINQGKVRSALAKIGHVLPKKGEGEWTKIAQAFLDSEVMCRPRWESVEDGDEMKKLTRLPEPEAEEEQEGEDDV